MSSAMDKAGSELAPTKSKWTPNLKGDREEEQASTVTAASTASPLPPADASTSTQSVTEDVEEKENQKDEQDKSALLRQRQVNDPDKAMRHSNNHVMKRNARRKKKNTVAQGSKNSRSAKATSSLAPKLKRRKRGRYVRVAAVNDDTNTTCSPDIRKSGIAFPPLPRTQYKATLKRRAIRLVDEGSSAAESSVKSTEVGDGFAAQDSDDVNYSEYGDISLGMKLLPIEGRVVVQKVIPLADGRASPAQLAGVIQRGDVLLSIDNLSLVNLDLDQLMKRLNILSQPCENGSYRRTLELRFETGVGMEPLKKHERAETAAKNERKDALDAANDMFALFPMVDQLSGQPFFEDQSFFEKKANGEVNERLEDDDRSTPLVDSPIGLEMDPEPFQIESNRQAPHDLISSTLAQHRSQDRHRFASQFFVYEDDLSVWLRTATGMKYNGSDRGKVQMGMTQSERVEKGTKVMALVKALSYNMEEIDRGKDMRSFRRWNTTLSLRSGASVRRRHVLDSASLPTHRADAQSAIDEIDSMGSGSSGSIEGVDGDELLLGLAAHDDIWKKQVVDTLKRAIQEMETGAAEEEKEEEQKEDAQDIDSAITKQLGTFLFGENMSRIITKKKKSSALPPEEVTSVLFDLTTNIASSAPEEITVFGRTTTASISYQGSSQSRKKLAQQSSDVILATRFLLDEAIPIWLQSFRPLPWEERRVLWPRIRHSSTNDSYGGTNTVFSDDSLTVESAGSARSPGVTRKNLRELIEDQELNIEARAETCFLTTYYFTQKILEGYLVPRQETEEENFSSVTEGAIDFINIYGSYLQMHTSLSYAALVHAEPVIEQLLAMAVNDPSHRDATKEIQKGDNLTFYDNCKLSAVVQFLHMIRYESRPRHRQILINLCVSAYPDVQPWQFREACLHPNSDASIQKEMKQPCSEAIMEEVFYTYLSQLMNPLDGNNDARHDRNLVEEWCSLSLGYVLPSDSTVKAKTAPVTNERMQNFLSVASRASSNHLVYHRDLEMLLDMCMAVSHHSLALDLAGEILDSKILPSRESIAQKVLEYLKEIALDALASAGSDDKKIVGLRTLKRVLHVFHKMSTNPSSFCRSSIVVADELHTLLNHWKSVKNSSGDDVEILHLIDFFIAESDPRDILTAVLLWSNSHEINSSIFPRLHEILRRGVDTALRSELSGSLLRLKFARTHFNNGDSMIEHNRASGLPVGTGTWKRMSTGSLDIDK